MFLRHSEPSEHSEIYCGHTGLKGHFWCKLKTSGPSQARRTWDKEQWIKKNGECTLLQKKTQRGGCRQTSGPLNRRNAGVFLSAHVNSEYEPLPSGTNGTSPLGLASHPLLREWLVKQLPFAFAIWRALNYFVRSLKVQCASVALKSWRECKKVDFCE